MHISKKKLSRPEDKFARLLHPCTKPTFFSSTGGDEDCRGEGEGRHFQPEQPGGQGHVHKAGWRRQVIGGCNSEVVHSCPVPLEKDSFVS